MSNNFLVDQRVFSTKLVRLEDDSQIKKYGTFFDSKYEIVQLYILFMFFGVHSDIINQLPDLNKRGVYENDVYLTFPEID